MPITANTDLVASMSIAGVPPFNGFFSKLIIIFACIEAGRFGYAICAIVGSILTLASFMKVQKYAFFGKLSQKWQQVKEVPVLMCLAMVVLALICLAGGLLITPFFKSFLGSAVDVLLLGTGYSGTIFGALK